MNALANPNSPITPDDLASLLIARHVSGLAGASVADIAEHFVGIYAVRPTSWMAAMARNIELDAAAAVEGETNADLMRLPGVRRSKFLVPRALAAPMFTAPLQPLESHAWRLRDVGTDLNTYRSVRPALIEMTTETACKLADLRKELSLGAAVVRALVTVACYDGALIRSVPDNPWSNRWMYAAAPPEIANDLTQEAARLELARRYIRGYGPARTVDLAWWMGISEGCAAQLMGATGAVHLQGDFWIDPEHADTAPPACTTEQITFLPAWDPIAMGYAPGSPQRSALKLDAIGYDQAGNGLPIVLLDGRAAARWRTRLNGRKRVMEIDTTNLPSSLCRTVTEAGLTWAARTGLSYDPDTPTPFT